MSRTQRPNILYILSDQHTPFVTGCYGDKVVRTPELDRLAAEGIVFDAAYTAAPVCVPARMSLLTGCFPHRQDCWTNTDVLASDRPTYAHALAAAGLKPIVVGRMHSLGPDQLRGFSERFVGDHSPNHEGSPRISMGQLIGTTGPGRQSVELAGAGQSAYELHDLDVVVETVRLAARLADEQEAGADEPFFVHVGLMLPHQPYVADQELFKYYYERVPDPQIPAREQEQEHPYHRVWKAAMDITSVGADEVRRARAAYYALTETMDRMIGSMLDAFRDHGLLDNTLVIYCSDHGDQIGERGLWWKHSFYEHSVRVPVVMSWPGVIPAGERRSQVINLVDLTPTFLDLTGAPELPAVDGRSLSGILKDRNAPWIDETYSEYCTDGLIEGMSDAEQQRMIRSGPWKAVYFEGYPMQLFNLDDDPQEVNNLVQDAKYSAVLASLTSKLLAGWRPKSIATTMEARKLRKLLLREWAARSSPADQFRWKLNTEDNWLLDR